MRVHLTVRDAEQALDRTDRDEDADEREETGLCERREVLRLTVTELMLHVRRTGRDAHREVREECSNEVGARVRGLRDKAEAVRREADGQLEDDEHCRRDDGDEC